MISVHGKDNFGKKLFSAVIILMIMVSVMPCHGKGFDDGVWVELEVRDKFSKQEIKEVRFGIYRATDSVGVPIRWWPQGKGAWRIHMLEGREGDYYITVMAPTMAEVADKDELVDIVARQGEFESIRVPFKVEPFKGNIKRMHLPNVYLKRKARERNINLKEVEVKASKVMFYHKGDTLVYNADAFVLAQGSMLDALLEQMPGVVLKSDGEILVNGKKVDALLLNGKNFFDGNKELMLDNLPAYTVKDVAVYDKRGRTSRLTGMDGGDFQHVMDVRLKREYRMGWSVNAEAGYGTHDRYLGKLFGMWFSENASLILHGNLNNLNDASTPGRYDGSWSRDRMQSGGEKTEQSGGLSYSVHGQDDIWETSGSVSFIRQLNDVHDYMVTQNYLDSGDLFSYKWSGRTDRSTGVSTRHLFAGRVKSLFDIRIKPEFTYRHLRNRGDGISAMFNAPQDSLTVDEVKGMLWGDAAAAGTVLNRHLDESLERGDIMDGKVVAEVDVKLKSTGYGNWLRLTGDYDFNRSHTDRFNRYRMDYDDDKPVFSSRYFRNHPSRHDNFAGSAFFQQQIDGNQSFITVKYTVGKTDEVKTSDLYCLEHVAGFDAERSPLGILPSQNVLMGSIDRAQSYNTKSEELDNKLHLSITKNVMLNKVWNLQGWIAGAVDWSDRTFRYFSNDNVPEASRNSWLPSINALVRFMKRNLFFNLSFTSDPEKVPLLNAIDRIDVTDPLYVRMGNPDIRDSRRNNLEFQLFYDKEETNRHHHLFLTYENVRSAVGSGSYFNTVTGVQTTRPYNVNGNWRVHSYYYFYIPFGAYNKFVLWSTTNIQYRASVDLSGALSDDATDFSIAPPTRKVYTFDLNPSLSFEWHSGGTKLQLSGDVNWRDYRSRDEGFSNFSAWNTNVGASGVFNLPDDWSVSTDLNLYTRRGYADSRLNTSDVVWNARVSKSVMKGALVFAVDGYDLLRQLSNVSYTINAQARTETVSNVIPSYVLFHVYYRFNKNPGKK